MKTIVFVALTAAVLVWGLVRLTAPPSSSTSKGGAEPQPENTAPSEIDRPTSVRAFHRRRPQRQSVQSTPPKSVQSTQPKIERKSRRDGVQIATQLHTSVEAAWSSQTRNADWSTSAENRISRAIGDFHGLSSFNVACRRTLCKVDLQFDSVAKRDAALPKLPAAIPWQSDGFFKAEKNGFVSMFVTREGSVLPRS